MAGLSGAARLIIGAARVQLGVTRAAARALLAADGFVAGALDAALSEQEKSALGVALYDASPRYRAAERHPHLNESFMTILGLEHSAQFEEIVDHHEQGEIPSTVM